MKLEQRLGDLTRQLASARRDGDDETIEELEDAIDEIEYLIEEEYTDSLKEDWS